MSQILSLDCKFCYIKLKYRWKIAVFRKFRWKIRIFSLLLCVFYDFVRSFRGALSILCISCAWMANICNLAKETFSFTSQFPAFYYRIFRKNDKYAFEFIQFMCINKSKRIKNATFLITSVQSNRYLSIQFFLFFFFVLLLQNDKIKIANEWALI